MAKIQTAIELQDNFSPVLQNMIGFINLTMGSMLQMQDTLDRPFEATALQGMQEYANQTTIAMQRLQASLDNVSAPDSLPVSLPPLVQPTDWQWHTDTMPVFTNTGIERFEREIQTANRMLDSLSASQAEIAAQAAQTGIFQPNATQDLYNIAQRINAIQIQITNLENNPAGLSWGAANNELERLRAQLGQAVQEQQILNNAVAGMDVQSANAAYLRLAQTVSSTERQIRDSLSMQANWQWQVDELPVFSGSGIERFEQELSSVNSRLNALYNIQAQIAAAASRIDWLPDNAVSDLSNMQNRLQVIWRQVNLIGSNPLNFGSDVANQELERMRGQLVQAVQEQERLNIAIDGMDVQAANNAYLQLSQTVSGLEGYIRDNVNAQGEFNETLQEGVENASNLGGMLAGAVKAYLGLAGLRKAFDFGRSSMSAFDVQMNAEVQLATVAGNMGMADYYEDMLAQAAAIQGRGIYGDEIMIAGAAELSTYFHDGDAVLSMMDTLSNYAAGMSGGGELNAQQMTDFATGLGKVMSGSYDAMTKKGFQFSDAQKAIIEGTASHVMIAETLGEEYLSMSADMQAAAAINQVIAEGWGGLYEAMSNTPQGQIIQLANAFGDLKEQIGGQIYPYVMLFVGAFRDNWPVIESVLLGIASGFDTVLGVLSWVVKAGLGFADMLIANWSWLSPIIYGVAGAVAVYYGSQLAANAVGLVSRGIHIAMAAAQMVQAAATGVLTESTVTAITAQQGLNATLYACPITWIAIGIIGVAAAFYAAVAAVNHFAGTILSATGLICGTIAAAAAFIGNTFVGLLSGMIQLFWTIFVAPFMGIIEWILNACNGGFDSFAGAVANLIGQVISWFLSLGKVVTTIIDAIFGSDWTGGLKNLQNEVLAWGKNENAISFAAEMDPANYLSDFHLSYTNSFNAGYGFGENLFNNPFGVQELDMSAYDTLSKGPWEDMNSSLAEIANNTGDMAHELSMTDEDLKYLRDIAERDTVNRYTTAEIVLHMGGITNNVSKMDDVDGIINQLAEGIIEKIEVGVEGLHI